MKRKLIPRINYKFHCHYLDVSIAWIPLNLSNWEEFPFYQRDQISKCPCFTYAYIGIAFRR